MMAMTAWIRRVKDGGDIMHARSSCAVMKPLAAQTWFKACDFREIDTSALRWEGGWLPPVDTKINKPPPRVPQCPSSYSPTSLSV